MESEKTETQPVFYDETNTRDRIGIAKGKLPELDFEAFQSLDEEIEALFLEECSGQD